MSSGDLTMSATLCTVSQFITMSIFYAHITQPYRKYQTIDSKRDIHKQTNNQKLQSTMQLKQFLLLLLFLQYTLFRIHVSFHPLGTPGQSVTLLTPDEHRARIIFYPRWKSRQALNSSRCSTRGTVSHPGMLSRSRAFIRLHRYDWDDLWPSEQSTAPLMRLDFHFILTLVHCTADITRYCCRLPKSQREALE